MNKTKSLIEKKYRRAQSVKLVVAHAQEGTMIHKQIANLIGCTENYVRKLLQSAGYRSMIVGPEEREQLMAQRAAKAACFRRSQGELRL